MTKPCDLLITGTGNFAERILGDLALMVRQPLNVTIAARAEETERMTWLRVASNARASIAGRPLTVSTAVIDWDKPDEIAALLEGSAPRLIVHAASVQSPSALFNGESEWERLVRAGTLSLTVPIQAFLAVRLFSAVKQAGLTSKLINCCYPDGTNALLTAMGFPVLSGAGNVAILAAAFAGELGIREQGRLRVLAHHQNLYPWRGPVAPDHFPLPRVWADGQEITDIRDRFAKVRLTMGPAIPISGSTGVPLFLALLEDRTWLGHAPGVNGLPGGYPVRVTDGRIELDLPDGLSRQAAIDWQLGYERACGLTVENGRLRFHGRLKEQLMHHAPDLAAGFHISDYPIAVGRMLALREELLKRPAATNMPDGRY